MKTELPTACATPRVDSAHPTERPRAGSPESTIAALQKSIFGAHSELHRQVREVVRNIDDRPRRGANYVDETRWAPRLLRAAIAGLDRTAREISGDTQLRGALCDAAQVLAPRLLLVLTGHFDLAIGAILRLGNGSKYQQECLEELDSGEALGVLMLTELGGTNGADQQTTAVWDPESDGFLLSTPSMGAVKFMPNVADPLTPKTVVVTARLMVDGTDEGVLPFLLRLRARPRYGWCRRALQRMFPSLDLRPAPVLAEGAYIEPLPDKVSAPMDHAMIRFDRVFLPRESLLGGDWANLRRDGRFVCDLPRRRRFHQAIGVLGEGRLDLANAASASARAALAGLVNYAGQRRSPKGVVMSERDAVQLDTVSALAAVYSTSVLGRHLRDIRADGHTVGDNQQTLLAMLAKPLLSNTAHAALMMCRQRTAAQGSLRNNLIVDWIGNLEAIITAEGENQIMQVTAGKRGHDLTALRLPGTPTDLPWYIAMLAAREATIADYLTRRTPCPASSALGPDSAAIELSEATGHRLAATAMLIESRATGDPKAQNLLESVCAAYALEVVYENSAWYLDHPDFSKVVAELRRHRGVLIAHMQPLIAGFDIPLLDAPIFSRYIESWTQYSEWSLS